MYEVVPIPEMNEVLAVFMGNRRFNHEKCVKGKYIMIGMNYDSNWKPLIRVWLKIQNIGADCGITFKPYHIAFHVAIDQGDILAAHRTCYDFIKRYNEIQSQTKQ